MVHRKGDRKRNTQSAYFVDPNATKVRFTKAQAEQENKWAQEIYQSRKRFVDHVEAALKIKSPTRRRELYEQWRFWYGDNVAREYAKYTESIFQGCEAILLVKLRDMCSELPTPIPIELIREDHEIY